jgi:methionyl aminopeptidase|tara:strand:- start:1391 stop:2134 length:744 start_codon:yes stop_codon:yes gene_type:complete
VIHIRSTGEVQKISRACQIVKETLEIIQEMIVPGISTLELDIEAEKFIRSKGAQPGFKGLYGYPATLCVSVEDEVVHGIPNNRRLQDGEIVSVDVGSLIEGYYGDHAKSFAVGKVDPEKEKLMSVTRECLLDGIDQATPGNHIGDIGYAVQKRAESNGYGVVTELVGHGIGTKLHEDPQIPNFGKPGTGPKIEAGMCFAIEPMINMGTPGVYTKKDGWTVCTKDGMPSAHFEHTITITEDGAKILTI